MRANEGTWRPAPRQVTLRGDEVHVWRARLSRPASYLRRLFGVLSEDEVRRAETFHFERDRARFVAGRGLLRVILGRYLDCSPRRFRFTYSRYGRPALVQEAGWPAVRFNLSHSGDCALYAVARGREVGVDVEQRRVVADADRVARRFFSSNEYAHFRRFPPQDRQEAFLHCWTCKEAYIKAVGEGLSYPLDRFDVSVDPSRAAALLRVADAPEEAARWTLRKLRPDAGHLGAVAVEGCDWTLTCWRF